MEAEDGTFVDDETTAAFVTTVSAAFNKPGVPNTTSPATTAIVKCKTRISKCCGLEPLTSGNLPADDWFKRQFIWGDKLFEVRQGSACSCHLARWMISP